MDTSDIIQSEMIKELESLQSNFEFHFSKGNLKSMSKEEIDYREKLERFGFKHNRIIKDHTDHETFRGKLKKIDDITLAIDFYKNNYPLFKVIPLSLMIKISEKYNLFMSKSENFIGDIPIKNLQDLEKFSIYEKDHYVPKVELPNNLKLEPISFERILAKYDNEKLYMSSSYRSMGLHLYVTAPREEFTLNPNLLTVGNFLIKNSKEYVKNYEDNYRRLKVPKDPIIWIPVQFPMPGGACMIITKWGEEAKYPEFTNPIDN